MCKVTRNARSALLSVRQAAQVHAPGTLKEAQPIGAKQQQQDEKLVILPTQTVKKHVHIEEMVVVKESESETTSCSSSASATAAQAQTHATESTSVGSASASLRAISALCLPEAPNVVTGALIRECLLGQVNLGSYALGNGQFLPVVVKEFNLTQVLNKTTKNGQGLHEDALSELQIHAYIQKKQVKNVIGLYAMHLNASSNKLFAYLEYAAKGELFSVLQARGNAAMPFAVASNFFVQLLHGIHALHSINVVHRDLSLENVLLTQDNEVKICDFGLATICAPGATINDGRAVGKVKYMCPELYYGEEYDPRLVDIWSAAVIFFLMLTGVFPYERPSAEDPRLVMLCHGQINELLAHWKRPALDQELLHLFSKMLCPPQQRWQAHQLLQLPFCQRFANVSKASIAAALDNEVSSASSYKNETMSTDSSVPSLCNSTGAHSTCSMDSPLSAPLDSGSEPASPNSLSQSPSHSYSQAHSEPTRPSSHFSASHPASVAPMAQCEPQPHPHPYSQKQFEGARQTAQEQQMQFYTPAPAFR